MPIVNRFLGTPFRFSRTKEIRWNNAELDIAAFLSVGPDVAEQVRAFNHLCVLCAATQPLQLTRLPAHLLAHHR